MASVAVNINSVAGAVVALHALRSRALSGEDVTNDLATAITRVSLADCNEVSDAMSLLSVAHLITGMLVDNLCQVDDTLESVEAVYIYAYLGRAIGFLETLLMRHDVTNGAVVN